MHTCSALSTSGVMLAGTSKSISREASLLISRRCVDSADSVLLVRATALSLSLATAGAGAAWLPCRNMGTSCGCKVCLMDLRASSSQSLGCSPAAFVISPPPAHPSHCSIGHPWPHIHACSGCMADFHHWAAAHLLHHTLSNCTVATSASFPGMNTLLQVLHAACTLLMCSCQATLLCSFRRTHPQHESPGFHPHPASLTAAAPWP